VVEVSLAYFVLEGVSQGLYNFGKTWLSELEWEKEVVAESKRLGNGY